jgi:hypothetical protein
LDGADLPPLLRATTRSVDSVLPVHGIFTVTDWVGSDDGFAATVATTTPLRVTM